MSNDVPVGRLRLGFSSATPISGKPCMGTCQCLFACCVAEAWVWAEWAALFMFQDSLLNESASPHSKWLLPWELTHGLPTTVLKYRLISRANTHKHTQEAAPWLDEINSLKDSHFGPGCTLLGPICSVSKLTSPAQPFCNVCKLQVNRLGVIMSLGGQLLKSLIWGLECFHVNEHNGM